MPRLNAEASYQEKRPARRLFRYMGRCAASLTAAGALAGTPEEAPASYSLAQEVTSSRIHNGYLEVNGRPHFPFMSWAQCAPDVVANQAMGVDTFMGSSAMGSYCTEQELADTVADDGYMIVQHGGRTQSPNIVGTYLPDEPDGYKIPPDAVPQIPGDNSTPVFETFAPNFGDRTAPPALGREVYSQYLRNLGRAGFAGFDLYYDNRYACSNPWLKRGAIYHMQRDLIELAAEAQPGPNDEMPTYQWLDVNRIDADACPDPVSPQKVKNQMWLAVAGGAKGLGFFTHSWMPGFWDHFAVTPEISATAKRTAEEIRAKQDILLKGDYLGYESSWEDAAKAGKWRYGGQTYILAVNSTETEARVSVPASVKRGYAKVLDQDRKISLVDQKLNDSLAPLEERWYVLGATPAKNKKPAAKTAGRAKR